MRVPRGVPGDVVLALDVDGVLLDPERAGRGPWMQALEDHHQVDASRLQQAFFEQSWPEVLTGKIAVEPALAAAIEELRWPLTVDELLRCWFEADFVPDRIVLDAANGWAADGARLVLVTNQEHRRARFLATRLGALIPVCGIAYSAAIGFVKDNPRFYPAACELLGIPPDNAGVVFVDDSLPNVLAARRHGWTGVHFTKSAGWHDEISSALSRTEARARTAGCCG